MPQSRRSLAVTEVYRARLLGIRERLERDTRARWPTIEDFDAGSEAWLAATALRLAGAQREAARATQGYLAAYLTSELGHRAQAPPFDTRPGFSRDGRPLTESLRSPLIGVLSALKGGKSPQEALQTGLTRALRMVSVDLDHAHRTALQDLMQADPRVEGWQRGVRGTCGACAGDIAVEVSVQLPGIPLLVHPNCQCVTVPVVTGVRNLYPLPTGQQIFERMGKTDQDEQFGPEKAEALRRGDVSLADLVATSPMATQPDFISERPLDAVAE